MMAAVLTEPGSPRAIELSQRTVVFAAIAALHALTIYLLVSASRDDYSRMDASVIQAEVLPVDRQIPVPPPLPPVAFQLVSHFDLPVPQLAIDVPAEQPATQAIQIPIAPDSPLPVAASAPPPAVDAIPVTRPRPISGPKGEDRYPSASMKAKESGTVVMNICVSQEGTVDSVELARSSGFPRLDKVAIGIAEEYRFLPATRLGHPVAACAHYNIIFKLKT
jgi:protein TonB